MMNRLTPERWQRIDSLFAQALEEPPHSRLEWLGRACAPDPELYDTVARMLANVATAEEVLGESVSDFAATALHGLSDDVHDDTDRDTLAAGARVGAYRLVREVGRGGMGTVYLAERDDAEFQKRVALKVVRRGIDAGEDFFDGMDIAALACGGKQFRQVVIAFV